jgi:adenosine deaminase
MINIKEYIKTLPKGELHVHLNGLVSASIVKKILYEENARIPQGFCLNKDLVMRKPSGSLQAYLKPWEVLRLIPSFRKNLSIIVDDAFINLRKGNILFAEIRNSIIYIAHLNKVTIAEAMGWLIEDIMHCSNKYQIKAGLILTVTRGDYCLHHLRSLLEAYNSLGKPEQVIGLDLAGNEDYSVSDEVCCEFKDAKYKYGFKITIHAGETGNLENIKNAITKYDADRIGHGTAAIHSIEIMDLLRKKDICVEACLKSNRLTNAVREGERHPVAVFIENDVPFVICSDNPSIHMSTINNDYEQFIQETNELSVLNAMFEKQKKYSFLRV